MGVVINQARLFTRSISSLAERSFHPSSLPPVEQLITNGGDKRIMCDPVHGVNKYGCSLTPEPTVLAYGSSTASTISPASFVAAERLRRRLLRAARIEAPPATYARELARIRAELVGLYGLSDLPDLDVIFAASGTDLHLIAVQLAVGIETSPLSVVMVEATETGSGVPAALGGRHFGDCTALGRKVVLGTTVSGGDAIEVAVFAARAADGGPRAAAVVDAEVEALVASAAATGRRVLLTLVDVSKTGMIAPSLAGALELRRRFPAAVEILVDACQFRLAPMTLRAYLQHGFWVALTGSKFVSGPAFSGALLIPEAAVRRLHALPLPSALGAYSARADWPRGWMVRHELADVQNFGLLLRWEAALAELRAFRLLSEDSVTAFLEAFAGAVGYRLTTDSAFQPLPVADLDRRPLVNVRTWDQIPTIFPFLLRHIPGSGDPGTPLSREETARVYELLGRDAGDHLGLEPTPFARTIATRRCQLGQPVPCGAHDGVPVSALRLCASMRLITDAVSLHGRGCETVIADAMLVLDKVAILASAISR